MWVQIPPWVLYFRGGIGIHTGLKILLRMDCEFESHRKYDVPVMELADMQDLGSCEQSCEFKSHRGYLSIQLPEISKVS